MEKNNCLRCNFRHKDNGNCTAVGGFCTAVPAAHCPLLRQYLDTGLTPEEVLPKDKADEIALKPMRLADLESICNYTRLWELAEADKDGRVVVLPCKGLSTKLEDGRQMILEQAIAHLESLLKYHDFECEACKQDHRDLLELLVELKERRVDNG